jgi:hypothetical protein
MTGKKKSAASKVEVSSDQLKNELTEIKDRVSALETIATISNRTVVEAYVRSELKTDKAVPILIECEEPRTREYLIKKFGFNSGPALDHHLKPLKQADLLQPHFDDDGTLTLEWSNLFRRLPNTVLKSILKKK